MSDTTSNNNSRREHQNTNRWTSADTLFTQLFRVPHPIPENEPVKLDRLSLLACERQGIKPTELLPRVEEDFNDSKSQAVAVKARAEAYEQRRHAKVDIVIKERESLVEVLMSVGTGRLNHVQNVLHSQLVAQPESAHCSDPYEKDAVTMLLVRESGHERNKKKIKDAIKETNAQGEAEIEQLRKRQMKSIETVLHAEVEKEKQMLEMQERDAAFKKRRDEEQRALLEAGKRQELQRRQKVARLQQKNEEVFRARREVLNAKAARREALLQQIEEREIEERQARAKNLDEGMKVVKARARQVREDEEVRCVLLSREVQSKGSLHDKRRANLKLRMKTARELRRIQDAKRFAAVHEYQSHLDDNVAKEKEEMDKTLDDARDRKVQHEADRLKKIEMAQEEELRKQKAAEQRREEREAALERKRQSQENRWQRKEEHLVRLNDAKKQHRALQAEIEKQHHEHYLDNQERLRRAEEHKQKVKDALLAEQMEHSRARDKQRREMRKRLTTARQHISDEKERLVESVVRLRSSPKFIQGDVKTQMRMLNELSEQQSMQRSRSRITTQQSPLARSTNTNENSLRQNSATAPASQASSPAHKNAAGSPVHETMAAIQPKRPATAN